MHLDLIDLRLFVMVNESGTLTGGASRSHMTLASASERVRNMEESLGAPLLVRDRRGVTPTDAGATLPRAPRRVLQQLDSLQDEIGGYGHGLKGHVRVLCNTSAIGEHLPRVLGEFLATYPGIAVDLEQRPSDVIADSIRGGQADLGMASDTADLEGLERFPYQSDPLVLIVPRGHALDEREALSFSDVVEAPFVGLVAGSALQEHLARHARRMGRQLSYRVRLGSFESVCKVVGAGIGMAILPRAVAVRCARSCRLAIVPLTDAWAARSLMLCVRRFDDLQAPARLLARHLLESRGEATSPAGRRSHRRAGRGLAEDQHVAGHHERQACQ